MWYMRVGPPEKLNERSQNLQTGLTGTFDLFEKKATIFISLSQLLIRQNLFINEKSSWKESDEFKRKAKQIDSLVRNENLIE